MFDCDQLVKKYSNCMLLVFAGIEVQGELMCPISLENAFPAECYDEKSGKIF